MVYGITKPPSSCTSIWHYGIDSNNCRPHFHRHDTVAEWLNFMKFHIRRGTANPLGSARACSNPVGVAIIFLLLCAVDYLRSSSPCTDRPRTNCKASFASFRFWNNKNTPVRFMNQFLGDSRRHQQERNYQQLSTMRHVQHLPKRPAVLSMHCLFFWKKSGQVLLGMCVFRFQNQASRRGGSRQRGGATEHQRFLHTCSVIGYTKHKRQVADPILINQIVSTFSQTTPASYRTFPHAVSLPAPCIQLDICCRS